MRRRARNPMAVDCFIRRACQLPGHRAARQMFNWTAAGCHRATRIGGGVVQSWRRLAAKVAAWSTIPASTYCSGVCTERSLPPEQIGSSFTHKSMVLSAYSGPTSISGSLIARINRVFGFPIKATAATRSATSGGIGFGTPSGAPSGMTFAVTKPDHGGALGISAEDQLGVRTVRRHGLDTSARVSNTVYGGGKFHAGGVVDRIYPDRLCAESRAQRVHECLSRRTNTGWLGGAAGEYHLDVGARLRGSGWDGCTQQRPTCQRHSTNDNNDMACPHGPYADIPRLRGRPERSTCNESRVNAAPVAHQRMMTSGSASEVRRVRSATARSGSPELWSPEDEPESDGLADAAHGAAANPAPIPRAARHLREAVMSVVAGTTIQRDPRDGEPWVRAAMFSALEAAPNRGRELAAGGKGKP